MSGRRADPALERAARHRSPPSAGSRARCSVADEHRALLVVVLDDEHRRAGLGSLRSLDALTAAAARPARGASGQVDVDGEAAELAASRAHRARPSPRPGRARRRGRCPCPSGTMPAAGHAIELVEQPWQRVVGHARAAVLDRQANRVRAAGRGGDAQRRTGERVLDRVLDHVRDGLSRKIGSTRTGGASSATSRGCVVKRGLSRSRDLPTRSSSSNTSRSACSAPASMRLKSSRFVTIRLRYSTSRSIASTLSVSLSFGQSARLAATSRRPPGSWPAACAGHVTRTGPVRS